MPRLASLLAGWLALFWLAGPVRATVIEETVDLPVEVLDVRGNTLRQTIRVTVFRDPGRPKAPFLILNHGRSSDPAKRQAVRAAQFAANARYLVSKGFVVLFPVRIGFGASGGPDVEASGRCAARTYEHSYETGARQSIAVIEHARKLPFVDPARGIVLGQSFGGTTAIALAAKGIPGVLAAVNFAGGGGGRPDTHPGEPCSIDRMTALFASYGERARIPTLWLYSVNDRYWGPTLPRAWHKAFTDRGGTGEFVQLPAYKDDGHPVFTGLPESWKPAFEAFIDKCCALGATTAGETTLSSAAPIGSAGTVAAFSDALQGWAARHKVTRAMIVVRRGGRVVHRAGIGGGDPAAPVLLASLSKAITGACIATLVRDGRLSYATPLSQALAKFLAANGRPRDDRTMRITVAQLLTHRAGFPSSRDGEDPSIRSILEAYIATHSPREAPKPAYLAQLMATRLLRDPGQAFAYSNAGFFILGAIIEEATGRSYESYCREAVLAPAGAAGALDPAWGVLWAAGGWRMTGADYLAFLEQLDPKRAAFGAVTRAWMLDPEGKTYGTAKPQSWYGPGVRMREEGRGLEIWHTGSWRRRLAPDAQGQRSAETSTLAVWVADGTSWFVHSTPLVLDGAREELHRDLLRAHASVVQWP